MMRSQMQYVQIESDRPNSKQHRQSGERYISTDLIPYRIGWSNMQLVPEADR